MAGHHSGARSTTSACPAAALGDGPSAPASRPPSAGHRCAWNALLCSNCRSATFRRQYAARNSARLARASNCFTFALARLNRRRCRRSSSESTPRTPKVESRIAPGTPPSKSQPDPSRRPARG